MSVQNKTSRIIDLASTDMEWGTCYVERRPQRSFSKRVLGFAALGGYVFASFVAIPVLIALVLFPDAPGLLQDALVVLGLIGFAVLFQAQSRRGPKNALQVDYAASEVRLGSQMSDGTFIRHRTCSFRQIDKVSVDARDKFRPALYLDLGSERVTIRFQDADPRSLDLMAAKISAACASARKAPLRTRVQSMFLGVDAAYREVGNRVKSRIVTRAV